MTKNSSDSTTAGAANSAHTATDPTGFVDAGTQAFRRMARENLERAQSLADQMASVERQVMDRLKAAAHDGARLMADTLDYGGALAAQWRALMLDAAKNATEAGQA